MLRELVHPEGRTPDRGSNLHADRHKGSSSRKTGLAMAFRLTMSARAKWRKRDGRNRRPEIVQAVEFRDGVGQLQTAA